MRLADRVAQCRTPFVVQSEINHALTRLNGASDFAADIAQCPIRYVFNDDLTRLCTALAYSKGARNLACADLLHVPARHIWVEWCESAWLSELERYGMRTDARPRSSAGRRGALIRSSASGRCGLIRSFWSVGETELDVLASSMEAYFDLDTEPGEEPAAPDESAVPDRHDPRAICVFDSAQKEADILRRCFRFRYERSWAEYYQRAMLKPDRAEAVARHALGTIAPDIPMLLAFFLLLSTRTGLPRRSQSLERLNRSRLRAGKIPLLDHIEVMSPLMSERMGSSGNGQSAGRRAPRLHHVRGHLVRHGSQLFWRVPHLRGSARSGVVQSRTVTWTIERPALRPAMAAMSEPAFHQ
jgi:hypothetical protein